MCVCTDYLVVCSAADLLCNAFEALNLLPCSLVIAGNVMSFLSFLSLSCCCIMILKSKHNI